MSKNKIDEEGIVREGEILDEEELDIEEKKEADDTQSSKGDNEDGAKKDDEEADLPFHKHPRWIARQQEIEELKQQIADLEEVTKTTIKEPQKDSTVKVPQEFIDMFGEYATPESWEKWQKLTARQKDELEKEVIEKIRNEDKAQKEAIEKGKQYVENSLKALEESGNQFDRNELVKFMIDFEEKYAPIVNKEGNYDFEKGLELMQKMKAETKTEDVIAKKKIAAITSDKKSNSDDGKSKTLSTRDLRNKSFTTLGLED